MSAVRTATLLVEVLDSDSDVEFVPHTTAALNHESAHGTIKHEPDDQAGRRVNRVPIIGAKREVTTGVKREPLASAKREHDGADEPPPSNVIKTDTAAASAPVTDDPYLIASRGELDALGFADHTQAWFATVCKSDAGGTHAESAVAGAYGMAGDVGGINVPSASNVAGEAASAVAADMVMAAAADDPAAAVPPPWPVVYEWTRDSACQKELAHEFAALRPGNDRVRLQERKDWMHDYHLVLARALELHGRVHLHGFGTVTINESRLRSHVPVLPVDANGRGHDPFAHQGWAQFRFEPAAAMKQRAIRVVRTDYKRLVRFNLGDAPPQMSSVASL